MALRFSFQELRLLSSLLLRRRPHPQNFEPSTTTRPSSCFALTAPCRSDSAGTNTRQRTSSAVVRTRRSGTKHINTRGYGSDYATNTRASYSTTTTTDTAIDSDRSSSISPSEVSHFSSLASTWWDPHGPSRLLHLMNPLRHEFLASLSVFPTNHSSLSPKSQQRPPSSSSPASAAASAARPGPLDILDIGTGAGIFAESAARLPTTSSVLAIDPTPSLIDAARAHLRCDPPLTKSGKLKYECCAVEDLPPPSPSPSNNDTGKKYDVISLFEVLEHISLPAPFLRHAASHLRPGGWLVGSTISRSPVSWLTTKLIAEAPWPVGLVPRGTHDWSKYLRPEEVAGWFRRESCRARAGAGEGEGQGEGEGEGGGRRESEEWGDVVTKGCVYLPGLGWKWVEGSERWGNYFFGVQKLR